MKIFKNRYFWQIVIHLTPAILLMVCLPDSFYGAVWCVGFLTGLAYQLILDYRENKRSNQRIIDSVNEILDGFILIKKEETKKKPDLRLIKND